MSVTINGTDLATLGFRATRRRLPRLGGERTTAAAVPGRPGGVRLGGGVEPDRLVIEGVLTGSDHADLLAKYDSLAARLQGACIIRFADRADREWVGHLQQTSGGDEVAPQWTSRGALVTLEFLLEEPLARAQTETTVALTHATTTANLALGTAPSGVRLEVTNGATAAITRVQLRCYDRAGAAVLDLVWTGSVATGKKLIVDAEAFGITNDGANAIDGLTAASVFPMLDPTRASLLDRLRVDVTGGPASTLRAYYRKRWF